MDDKILTKTLRELATSPVQKDREAIARIEKASGTSIIDLLEAAENNHLALEVYSENQQKSIKMKSRIAIVASGFVGAGIVGIFGLWMRPNVTVPSVVLAFASGASACYLRQK